MNIFDLLSRHLAIAALLTSALWFYGGYLYRAKGKQAVGVAWQVIAILILAAFCTNAVASRGWYSFTAGSVAIIVELWFIRQFPRRGQIGYRAGSPPFP